MLGAIQLAWSSVLLGAAILFWIRSLDNLNDTSDFIVSSWMGEYRVRVCAQMMADHKNIDSAAYHLNTIIPIAVTDKAKREAHGKVTFFYRKNYGAILDEIDTDKTNYSPSFVIYWQENYKKNIETYPNWYFRITKNDATKGIGRYNDNCNS